MHRTPKESGPAIRLYYRRGRRKTSTFNLVGEEKKGEGGGLRFQRLKKGGGTSTGHFFPRFKKGPLLSPRGGGKKKKRKGVPPSPELSLNSVFGEKTEVYSQTVYPLPKGVPCLYWRGREGGRGKSQGLFQ